MTLTPWQRANILAAFNYLKERARARDSLADTLAHGLAEVLEPSRRTLRLQREAAQAAAAAADRERRTTDERRRPSTDRRQKQNAFDGGDRRSGRERRAKRRRGMNY